MPARNYAASKNNYSRAFLTLIKSNFDVIDNSSFVHEQRSGWMLKVVNREQFQDGSKQKSTEFGYSVPPKTFIFRARGHYVGLFGRLVGSEKSL